VAKDEPNELWIFSMQASCSWIRGPSFRPFLKGRRATPVRLT